MRKNYDKTQNKHKKSKKVLVWFTMLTLSIAILVGGLIGAYKWSPKFKTWVDYTLRQQGTIDTLNDSVYSYIINLQEKEQLIAEKTETINTLQEQNDNLSDEKTVLQQTLDAQNAQLIELSADAEANASTIASLIIERDNTLANLNQVTAQLEASNQNIADLQTEIADLNTQIDSLNETISSLQSSSSQLSESMRLFLHTWEIRNASSNMPVITITYVGKAQLLQSGTYENGSKIDVDHFEIVGLDNETGLYGKTDAYYCEDTTFGPTLIPCDYYNEGNIFFLPLNYIYYLSTSGDTLCKSISGAGFVLTYNQLF